ncbi:MAG TPA: phosphoribosylformylglycinamidine synthase I [Rectinemataceae bacterium]
MKPKALILHAAGTNRDGDAAYALAAAGADPRIVHVKALKEDRKLFSDASILLVPGGFSYADALGAGRLFALDMASYFREEIGAFVASGKPVIGICNGFQALVKAGILPGWPGRRGIPATLAPNEKGRFECRWVALEANPASPCVWTRGLDELFSCPVAHGEGRFLLEDSEAEKRLLEAGQIALVYARPGGGRADGAYPFNPNGSAMDIAGICNPAGNVLGLMPHPENNVRCASGEGSGARPSRKSRAPAGGRLGAGLELFKRGVAYARGL